MTGYAVRGHMGFVSKEGETFDRRLNVRLHSVTLDEIERLKRPKDSTADWIREAVAQRLQREMKR